MTNEERMRVRGVEKIEKEIFSIHSKDPNRTKNIGSIQVGQQLILDESIKLAPEIWSWINKKTWKSERADWLRVFVNEKTTSSLIASTLLLLIGSIHAVGDSRDLNSLKRKLQKGQIPRKARHNTIEKIDEKIFKNELGFAKAFRFTELVVDYCSFLTRIEWLEHNKKQVRKNIAYSSNLLEQIVDGLSLRAAEAFYPLPITEPPLNWEFKDNRLTGGYHTYQYDMIRVRGTKPDYSKYSKNIFDALNFIQSTKWRINEAILNTVETDLKAPKKENYVKTEFPTISDFKNLSEEEKTTLTLYNAEVGDFESAVGKWRSFKMAINIAKMYLNQDIYFPHNYDFRGRIYPIAIGLSPQGPDAVKAILEFAEGEVLTERGRDWCYAYLASLYGDDKLHFEDRVKRGEELLHADYRDADEPYQFLAHQLELQKYEIDHSYPVKTRIHLDACNSGSQFASAITGDLKGCIVTNVIPRADGKREDAYQEVADITLSKLQHLDDGEETQALIDLISNNGRKICKRPVMVSNYGGTAGGRTDILYHLFREFYVPKKWINRKTAAKLSKVIGDAIEGVLEGGKQFEKYIQEMNIIIAKRLKHIYWYTQDGFYVEHVKYREKAPIQVECRLPSGKKTQITRPQYSAIPNPGKMKNAISPNYIHSLDAMLLRQVALKMKKQGVKNASWIHDSYGTSPNNVDAMLDIIKRRFIKIIENRPLKDLDDQLKAQATECRVPVNELSKIKYPQLKGFNSRGGLECLMESEWFFS
jgi:DNA-directed RNA polymerase